MTVGGGCHENTQAKDVIYFKQEPAVEREWMPGGSYPIPRVCKCSITTLVFGSSSIIHGAASCSAIRKGIC
jgi:hypothetical protein